MLDQLNYRNYYGYTTISICPPTFLLTTGARKSGRSQFTVPQSRVARSISVKDVIAVLEREPQTSKTTLIYRLYEKMRTDAVAE